MYLAGLIMVGALGVPGLIDNVRTNWSKRMEPNLSREALGHYHYIQHHLKQPFHGYLARQTLFDGFRIVALSHMACGLLNVVRLDSSRRDEVIPLLDEIARRAMSPYVAPFPRFVERPAYWKKENLYLSHLNLILGAYRAAGGDQRYDALHNRISGHLSRAILQEPDFILESYGGGDKWPADQTATLCSLYLYDRIHGTQLSRRPISGWLAFMKIKMTDPVLGVHESYLSPDPNLRIPRGCALSWSSLYMAQFAPHEAKELYDAYRKHYFRRRLGLGGFREWPPGKNFGMSADTGPILFGIGFAASGFGIGPARLFGDRDAYTTVMRTGSLIGAPVSWAGRRFYLFSPLLGEAILFHGETATRWFPEH